MTLIQVGLVGFLAFYIVCDAEDKETGFHCFDITCGVKIDDWELSTDVENCTDDDIGYEYTVCDENTNTHSLMAFWKPPALCQGMQLPPPLHNIPCDLICTAGSKLDPMNHSQCSECEPGRFSVGGGIAFGPPWTALPVQFDTECSDESEGQNCQHWMNRVDYLDSGDNHNAPGAQSILALQFTLRIEGSLTFEWKLDARNNIDIFAVLIDMEIPRNPIGYWLRRTQNWQTFKIKLSKGYHYVRWVYEKDSTWGWSFYGQDKAYIRSISIQGLSPGDRDCQSCPPGKYSNSGENKCLTCPSHTKAVGMGNSECESCPGGKTSFPGSDTCVLSRPCDSNDYYQHLGNCNSSGYRQISYKWLEPVGCDSSGAKLPDPIVTNCSTPLCPEGYGLDDDSISCKACRKGTISTKSSNDCIACDIGTYPNNMVFYKDSWDPAIQNNWDTGCIGNCGTKDGWRFGGSFVESGINHGIADVYLELELQTLKSEHPEENVLEIEFNYSMSCSSLESSFQFFIDGHRIWDTPCKFTDCNYSSPRIQMNSSFFSPSKQMNDITKLRWNYHKLSQSTQEGLCDQIKIYSMKVKGINALYGASNCRKCPGGIINKEGEKWKCDLCKAGTIAKDFKCSSCKEIGNDKFSPFGGMSECYSCGENMKANKNNTGCNNISNVLIDGSYPIYPEPAGSSSFSEKPKKNQYFINLFGPDTTPTKTCQTDRGYCLTASTCRIKCREDGSYAPEQCNVAGDICWCVRADGTKISAPFLKSEGLICNAYGPNYLSITSCVGSVLHSATENLLPPRVCVTKDVFDDNENIRTQIGKSLSMGSILGYSSIPAETGELGYYILLTYGSPCESYLSEKKRYSTEIKFICNPGHYNSQPVFISLENCILTLRWRSGYACPLCERNNYEIRAGPCIVDATSELGGKRNVSHEWVYPLNCHGGVNLPETYTTTCFPTIHLPADEIVVDKSDYVLTPVEVGLISSFSIIIVIVGVIVIYWLVKKRNRVLNEYQVFKNTVHEMQESGSTQSSPGSIQVSPGKKQKKSKQISPEPEIPVSNSI